MLSRALRSGLSRSVRRAPPQLAAPCLRLMSTETKKEESFMDIVKEHGLMTTIGFGSAILVGKELFMVNEEVLVLGIFSGVLFYGYTTLYDSINESAEEYKNTIRSEQVKAREIAISKLAAMAEEHKKFTQVSAEIKNMYETLQNTNLAYADAVNKITVQNYINGIEAELQDLYDTSALVESYQKDLALKKAAAGLDDYLKNKLPQKEKDAFFNNAISLLEGKGDAGKEDFILAQFKKELESVLTAMNNRDEKKAMAAIDAMAKSGEIDLEAPGMRTVRKLMN
mmetsp:Transcript_7978/g.11311  ORF Transcript_7978/g.11311 Transcript_7978/m.11311 type:complete len:283 (+) Transcript_7978:29-877(+)